MLFDPSDWIVIVLSVGVVFGLWALSRPKWPIKITMKDARVTAHEGLPQARAGRIVEFFETELDVPDKLTVYAMRTNKGLLHTKFVGQIDPGTQQQVRNFLLAEL